MATPLTRTRFTAAMSLALLAGFVDGFAFAYLGGYFVSFMSGNTTQAGVELVGGAWASAALAAGLVALFVGGAIIGAALSTASRYSDVRVLAVVTASVALALIGALVGWQVPAALFLAAGMGALNMVFARGGPSPIAITYMTGALVKVAQGLVDAARGTVGADWLRPLLMWTAIAAGAIAGAAGYATVGVMTLVIALAASSLALTVTAVRASRTRPIEEP